MDPYKQKKAQNAYTLSLSWTPISTNDSFTTDEKVGLAPDGGVVLLVREYGKFNRIFQPGPSPGLFGS